MGNGYKAFKERTAPMNRHGLITTIITITITTGNGAG